MNISNKLFLIKIKRSIKVFSRLFLDEFLAPFTDITARLQLLVFPFLIYFIFNNKGFLPAIEQVKESITYMQALLYATPVYIVFCVFSSLLKVKEHNNILGRWDGNCFLYKKPKRVFTKKITSQNIKQNYLIKVPDVEPNSYVSFHVSYSRGSERVKSQIGGGLFPSDWQHSSYKSQGSSRINSKKEVYLQVRIEPDTNDTIVYVDVLYWKIE